MRLFNSVDTISEKSDKYVSHGTAIKKLISSETEKELRSLVKEGDVG